MEAEQIARDIVQNVKENARADIYRDIYGIDRLTETIATALRQAYAEGYAAAREQAAGVAEHQGLYVSNEDVSRANSRNIATKIRAMEPPK